MEDARKVLGQEAKKLRLEAKKTQKEIAKEIGIYQNDLSAFENHGEKLGLDKITALFESFGYSLAPVKKKRLRKLSVDEGEIDNIASLLDTLNHEDVFESDKERSMWQTLKTKVKRVLEITDEIITEVIEENAEEDRQLRDQIQTDILESSRQHTARKNQNRPQEQ